MRRGTQTDEMRARTRRKSSLLLQGQQAKEAGRTEAATRFFGEAARLEEELAAAYSAQGITEQVSRHRFSAVSCWSQAGNFLRALELCDALTEAADTPAPLRERASLYAGALRERRDRLWAEIRQAERQLAA